MFTSRYLIKFRYCLSHYNRLTANQNTVTTAALSTLCIRQPPTQSIIPSCYQIRYYAKGKDKKKEKPSAKKNIEINEEFIKQHVNIDQFNTQMQKSLDVMKEDFIKFLSLRSTTGSIENIKINFEGKQYELQEIAQIVRKNPKTVVVNMIGFPQMIMVALTAIQKCGLNLNPQQDGTTIYIPVPKVTKEHREMLAKNAKAIFVKHRDGIKDVQNNTIKKLKKQSDVSQDDSMIIQNQLKAITDKYLQQAEKLLETKQSELLGGKS